MKVTKTQMSGSVGMLLEDANALQARLTGLIGLVDFEEKDLDRLARVVVENLREVKTISGRINREATQLLKTCDRKGIDLSIVID